MENEFINDIKENMNKEKMEQEKIKSVHTKKKKENSNGNNTTSVVLIVSILLSFVCGMLGAYLISQTVSVESVVKTITTSELVENSISSSVDKVYDSTVVVVSYAKGKQVSTGTGFIYKKDNKKAYIMTNNHVVDDADEIKIEFNDHSERVDAKLLGGETYSDIAVLTIEDSDKYTVVEIGESESIKLGDTIFTVGSPLGEQYFGTVTKGIISGKNRMVGSSQIILEVIQTDAAINEGNSGGPLVNINGEVIGVNSMKIATTSIEGMGFSIPINAVMSYVERLEKGEAIERPVIGITMSDVTNTWQLYSYGIIVDPSVEYGAVVISVQDGYPASIAGLQKGDVIIEIDGVKIEDSSYFRYALYKYEIGDTIKVRYYRNNKILETNVKLTKGAEA